MSSNQVTIAKMVSLDDNSPIALPVDFLETLKPKEGSSNAVMILAPSTKIIRIIPSKSDVVLKVAIEIGELSPDFLQELGVVFTQESCVYEGYIDQSDVSMPTEKLQSELQGIKGVSQVVISTLNP